MEGALMYNNRGILKGKGVMDVYMVLCDNPEGMRLSEISRILPHISKGTIRGILMRLKGSEMVCMTDRNGKNAHVWKKVR